MEVIAGAGWLVSLALLAWTNWRLRAFHSAWSASRPTALHERIDALHRSHDFAAEEQLQRMDDIESCTATAANEVRMAATQIRAITDSLARRDWR